MEDDIIIAAINLVDKPRRGDIIRNERQAVERNNVAPPGFSHIRLNSSIIIPSLRDFPVKFALINDFF